jgi:hypothetical protein
MHIFTLMLCWQAISVWLLAGALFELWALVLHLLWAYPAPRALRRPSCVAIPAPVGATWSL